MDILVILGLNYNNFVGKETMFTHYFLHESFLDFPLILYIH